MTMQHETTKPKLRSGSGAGCEGDECAGQRARRLGGLDSKSYACPGTADPVIWALMVAANDARADWREELADDELLTRIRLSKASEPVQWRRIYRMMDFHVRQLSPAVFELLKEPAIAAEMRALAPIVDKVTAEAAVPVIDLARALAVDLARALALALDLALAVALPSFPALIRELLDMGGAQ